MLDGSTIATVTDVLRPERSALIHLLQGLEPEAWELGTECPAYSVRGVASHILGDDLSLLSRQRDDGVNGLLLMADGLPGADFRTLLNAFNDQWVAATRFVSTSLLVTLLELVGAWTAEYYQEIDPDTAGEPVGFFGGRSSSSPFWQAIAREYIERWVHHSQIRRALGMGSLDEPRFLAPGVAVVAAALHVSEGIPASPNGPWSLGDIVLGSASQAATILTRGYTAAEVRERAEGPCEAVDLLAMVAGRPEDN